MLQKVGSIITIPPGNVQAVEDMIRFFYLQTYNPRLLPSAPMSMMQAQKRQAAHHVAVYDLARQKSYGVGGLSGRAHRAFQNGADGALAWLDQPANNTAKNAVRLLRMYVNLIYENDGRNLGGLSGPRYTGYDHVLASKRFGMRNCS
jgi:hypothetical protein